MTGPVQPAACVCGHAHALHVPPAGSCTTGAAEHCYGYVPDQGSATNPGSEAPSSTDTALSDDELAEIEAALRHGGYERREEQRDALRLLAELRDARAKLAAVEALIPKWRAALDGPAPTAAAAPPVEQRVAHLPATKYQVTRTGDGWDVYTLDREAGGWGIPDPPHAFVATALDRDYCGTCALHRDAHPAEVAP